MFSKKNYTVEQDLGIKPLTVKKNAVLHAINIIRSEGKSEGKNEGEHDGEHEGEHDGEHESDHESESNNESDNENLSNGRVNNAVNQERSSKYKRVLYIRSLVNK
ncbi:conserved Plasmodium protein, unknown function [Plasmodium ovale curtisi]|uniref:Uncharacterized protein n=1 Tax=Plasmodium ovale curtisi TaxID=864141 RepID=A0A1A8WKT7_PLAOA|nr:conserved Plasmodium protein, unknown function [Plasmodium ovale curtisi]SBS93536.1 conserved Plasmodium protein, unknown function [Plasmodium ovale curtisi]